MLRYVGSVLVMVLCAFPAAAQIKWGNDHKAALALARNSGRPLLLALANWN